MANERRTRESVATNTWTGLGQALFRGQASDVQLIRLPSRQQASSCCITVSSSPLTDTAASKSAMVLSGTRVRSVWAVSAVNLWLLCSLRRELLKIQAQPASSVTVPRRQARICEDHSTEAPSEGVCVCAVSPRNGLSAERQLRVHQY